ncbi:MAG: phage shock protein PspC, partial [Actinomycetia bacterium]|nr:phage shock protein PspC [Actinomycetes bacterium]
MGDMNPTITPRTPRRILRSRSERILGGVAGGLGEYLGVDPVLIRLGFVALMLLGGIGPLLYLVAWLIIPEAPAGADPEGSDGSEGAKPIVPAWAAVVALAILALIAGVEPLGFGVRGRVLWPFLLIAFGIAVLWARAGMARRPPGPDTPPNPASTDPTSTGRAPAPGAGRTAEAATDVGSSASEPGSYPDGPDPRGSDPGGSDTTEV